MWARDRIGSPPLEREDARRRAEALLRAVGDGAGSALLVEGPAGIGKSAFVRAVRELAADEGFTVLAARGAELERGFSFGVVRQLYESALASAEEHERAALLDGAAGLAQPALGRLSTAGDAAAAPSSANASFAVLH